MSATITVTSQAKIDAMVDGLLSASGDWTVHLGTSSPSITPASVVGDFADPFYPEYVPALWSPMPFVVDLEYVVHATGASVSFAAPSQMPQIITTVWVTYTDGGGQVQLLEAWYLPDGPVPFGPGGPGLVVNLGFAIWSF